MKDRSLDDWKHSHRSDISHSSDPLIRKLQTAADSGEAVEIFYNGGSNPGAKRKIKPKQVLIFLVIWEEKERTNFIVYVLIL